MQVSYLQQSLVGDCNTLLAPYELTFNFDEYVDFYFKIVIIEK